MLGKKRATVLRDYPDINAKIVVEYEIIGLVANCFDAGVHLGDQVVKDMLAIRIAPDLRITVVGALLLRQASALDHPHELSAQNDTTPRLITRSGLYAWEFDNDGQKLNVRV